MERTKKITAALLAAATVITSGQAFLMTGLAAQQNSQTTIEDAQVPLYSKPAGSHVLTPIASGVTVYKNDKATLDASNTASGYIMVKYTGSVGKIKVQVSKSGSETYTYDLNSSGTYEVFPLSEGNGSYQVKVFENIQGTQYSQAFSQSLDVNITDTFGPFLYPNQYVNFDENSKAVRLAGELAADAEDDLDVVTRVFHYITENITYDYDKAENVEYGYLPDIDETLETKTGICFDYAALMCAMLRCRGIPAKLDIGYTNDGMYHAWISTYLRDKGWVDNIIEFDGDTWQFMDPTMTAASSTEAEKKQVSKDTQNYMVNYVR